MGELLSLRYVGGGMVRPELPPRDHDRSAIRALAPDAIQAALGSGLYVPTYSDEEPEELVVEDNPADELPARLLGGPFLWTGSTDAIAAAGEAGDADGSVLDEALNQASYNDLRQIAKARGLDTTGTRAALIERLVASEPAAESDGSAGETD